MELTEKELVEEIRKVLIFEECTYKEGAWEKFDAKQQKKWSAGMWIKLSIVVLVFLVILGLLYFP